MSDIETNTIIVNSRNNPLTVFVEPRGEDYTLKTDEEIKIVYYSDKEECPLHYIKKDCISLYFSGPGGNFTVYHKDEPVESGFGRDQRMWKKDGKFLRFIGFKDEDIMKVFTLDETAHVLNCDREMIQLAIKKLNIDFESRLPHHLKQSEFDRIKIYLENQ